MNLYLLADTAEAKAALEMIKEQAKLYNESDRIFRATCLLLGVGAQSTLQAISAGNLAGLQAEIEHFRIQDLITPTDPGKLYGGDNRTIKLSQRQIEHIVSSFEPEPSFVFSGVVSMAQIQLMAALRYKGAYVVGYYDNLDLPQGFCRETMLQTLAVVHKLWLPSEFVAHEFVSLAPEKVVVTGHPDTQRFRADFLTATRQKTAILDRIPELRAFLGDTKPENIICYIAAYGADEYKADLAMFAELMQANPDFKAIISMHPGAPNHDFELDTVKSSPANIFLVTKEMAQETQVRTAQLCSLAGIIMTAGSTVAYQVAACFPERQVYFVRDPGSTAVKPSIVPAKASLVVDPNSFKEELRRLQSLKFAPDVSKMPAGLVMAILANNAAAKALNLANAMEERELQSRAYRVDIQPGPDIFSSLDLAEAQRPAAMRYSL